MYAYIIHIFIKGGKTNTYHTVQFNELIPAIECIQIQSQYSNPGIAWGDSTQGETLAQNSEQTHKVTFSSFSLLS